jgi:hypothetical protein
MEKTEAPLEPDRSTALNEATADKAKVTIRSGAFLVPEGVVRWDRHSLLAAVELGFVFFSF